MTTEHIYGQHIETGEKQHQNSLSNRLSLRRLLQVILLSSLASEVTEQCSAQASYNCMLLYGVFIPKSVVSLELILHDLSVRNLITSLVQYSPIKPKKHMKKWFSCLQKAEYCVIEEGDIPKSCKVIRKIMPTFFR